MSTYNRVRGVYATENRYILNDILRDEWGSKVTCNLILVMPLCCRIVEHWYGP